MHITLLTAGKMRGQLEEPLLNQYMRQCGWSINIREIQAPKYLSGTDLQNAEASYSSHSFSKVSASLLLMKEAKHEELGICEPFGAWRDDGIRKLTLIIGGQMASPQAYAIQQIW